MLRGALRGTSDITAAPELDSDGRVGAIVPQAVHLVSQEPQID